MFQHPDDPLTVIKATSEKIAFDFLAYLHQFGSSAPSALPVVRAVLGRLSDSSLSKSYYVAHVEKLYPLETPDPAQALLHKAWVATLKHNKEAVGIDPARLSNTAPAADLVSSLRFLNNFLAQNKGCFDGDTFTNCLKRLDGQFVLADPVTEAP